MRRERPALWNPRVARRTLDQFLSGPGWVGRTIRYLLKVTDRADELARHADHGAQYSIKHCQKQHDESDGEQNSQLRY